MPNRNSVAQSNEYLETTSYSTFAMSFYQTVTGEPNLNVNGNAFFKSISDPADRIVCVPVEYLKVLDLLLCKKRAGHRTVEFPRGTVCIEYTVTEERAHELMKPISYRIGRFHSVRLYRIAPNLSRTSQSPLLISSVMRRRDKIGIGAYGDKDATHTLTYAGSVVKI